MLCIGKLKDGLSTRDERPIPGGKFVGKTYIIKSDPDARPSPHAYLVEQPAHTTIQAHFHHQPQFQVFVEGNGMMGKHALEATTVHYANEYSSYGPIVAGESDLLYLTIRPMPDPGAQYLPERRHLMQPAPRRTLTSAPVPTSSHLQRLKRLDTACETVIEPHADGLASWMLRAPSRRLPQSHRDWRQWGAVLGRIGRNNGYRRSAPVDAGLRLRVAAGRCRHNDGR